MSRRMQWPLLPLVPLYRAAQALDAWTHTHGLRHTERLRWPVVSIGNLSVGGAGKTPLVIELVRALVARGWYVDVLSRGYGRASRAVEQANAAAESAAARYGDEPVLIARATDAPVFVGRSRAAAGRLAEAALAGAQHARRLHLLDDGMQHRALARDVEIVLLHRADFETTLLPAGRLREPLAALERADFVIVRAEDASLAARARRWMRSDAAVWQIVRKVEAPSTLSGPAVVFSAIAHPEEFVAGLRACGVEVAASHAWRDHHRYTDADLERLARTAAQHRASCFLTTEKDAVRLAPAQRARLEQAAPLLTAQLTVRLVDSEQTLAALEQKLSHANAL